MVGNNLKILQYLWKNNFEVDSDIDKWYSVIRYAIQNKNKKIIQWVIKNYPYQMRYLDEDYLDKFCKYKKELYEEHFNNQYDITLDKDFKKIQYNKIRLEDIKKIKQHLEEFNNKYNDNDITLDVLLLLLPTIK